jgi:translocation and assembly module TamA
VTAIRRILLGIPVLACACSILMLSAPESRASSEASVAPRAAGIETTRGTLPEASTGGLRYRLTIDALGDSMLDRAISESSMLARLQEDTALGAFGLIARAETDLERIDRVLRSFGYYDAVIAVRIGGQGLDDPALLPRLEQVTPGSELQVQVLIDPGPLYRLGTVRLDGPVTPAARAAFSLRSGEPATAPEVLAAGATVLEALREDGFPFAQVPPPEAIVDHRTRTMAVSYRAEPGERLPIGEIEIIGLERLRERYVRRRLGLQPGEPYSPSRLEAARRALVASEALASARLITASAPDAGGRVPLRLEVVERPLRVLRVAGAYSSDEGGSLSAAWTHRNLFGGAEQLTLGAEVSQISAGPLGDINDSASAALRIPDLWRRDLDLQLKLGAVSERLEAYDRDALTASAQLEQRLSARLRISAGLGVEHAAISQDGPAEDVALFSLPMTLDWDASDDPLDPRRGWRLAAQVTPAPIVQVEQGDADPFVRTRVVGSAYLDLSSLRSRRADVVVDAPGLEATGASAPPLLGRRVLAARLVVGRILGASASTIPPDWRFYAGGGGSVRGYPFQSIGPRTASGSPAGGDALLEGSLELRQRLGARWGMAGFIDIGDVSADGFRGFGNLAIGVGLGARFHTPVGPVRVDLATPLTVAEDDPPVQLYIGIGQAF